LLVLLGAAAKLVSLVGLITMFWLKMAPGFW
jgi:hypothetical protein